METSSVERPRPRHRSRAVLVLGLAAGLVLTVLMVRGGPDGTSTAADLRRITDSVGLGCREPSSDLDSTTGFAFDGTVVSLTRPADPGAPVLVELEVGEWFRGPPLDRLDVRLDPGTVRLLDGSGAPLAPGLRLLVSGAGWGTGEQPPAAAGCGRTRPHDAATADTWREQLPAPGAEAPRGPVAVYPDAGWATSNTERTPDVAGVLLHDGGCLYVAEGLTRWVPVFPSSSVSWEGSPPRLSVAGHLVDTGHPLRLAGRPATGVWPPAVDDPGHAAARAVRLDPAGVPAGCRDDVPRLLVADVPGGGAEDVEPVADDDPLVRAVRDAATRAGLRPTAVTGEIRRDAFGVVSVRAVAATEEAGELLVHVESVSYVAWPRAYAPVDATLRWSLDPSGSAGLPAQRPGAEVAVVDHADGTTQLLLRARPPVVVSVSAGPGASATAGSSGGPRP